MIASSLKEGDALIDLLLSKDADVNVKSVSPILLPDQDLSANGAPLMLDFNGQVSFPQGQVSPNSKLTSLIQTALHFCASKNNLDIARKLISHKASARVKDKRGQLPLHRAAAVGSVPMVNLLLENRSPLNATDISAYTALHHGMS